VAVTLALILVYGRFEPLGRWLDGHGIQVIFAHPLGPGLRRGPDACPGPRRVRAVAVVSGRLVDKTQTVTLLVEQRFQNFDQTGAYAASFALAAIAVVTLLVINVRRPKESEL